MFDPAAHPDFLGAILNTGVVRGKVGDIVLQVRRAPLKHCTQLPLMALLLLSLVTASQVNGTKAHSNIMECLSRLMRPFV
jgi:RNA-binding protein YlmH